MGEKGNGWTGTRKKEGDKESAGRTSRFLSCLQEIEGLREQSVQPGSCAKTPVKVAACKHGGSLYLADDPKREN